MYLCYDQRKSFKVSVLVKNRPKQTENLLESV
jgi:hypothetical protein